MCGRMTLTRSGAEIAAWFAEAVALEAGDAAVAGPLGGALRPRFNVAPSQDVLTIVPAEAGARFEWRRWGLLPSWAKDPSMGARLFNARSETVAEKPSFRAAFKRRRCLVAADGFYEWTPRNRGHRPFHFRGADGGLLAFAGLYEHWQGEGGEVVESCTVLTTDANADLEGVHHRMPVLLAPSDQARWIDPDAEREALQPLLRPAPPGRLARVPVTRWVNDPRHDDPRCLDPEPEVRQPALFTLDGGAGGGGDGGAGDEEAF